MDTNTSENSTESTGIVIVGAGIAGLGAAIQLEQANYKNYILLEAQSQTGGRISSLPWNNSWLELGAQFLHGKGSTLAQLAEERGFLSDIQSGEGEGLYLREDGSEIGHELVLEIDDIIKDILEDCEKYAKDDEIKYLDVEENIGKVLKMKFYKYLKMLDGQNDIRKIKEELFNWYVKFLIIDNACTSLEDLSVKCWGKYESVSGPEHNIFKIHYGSIVDTIANELTQNNLRLNSPVEKIEWNEEVKLTDLKPIVVTLQNNKKIFCNCIIITCSLGYLKENHDILFTPKLPKHLTKTIESMGFGIINKIFLDFDQPWWKPHIKGFQFLWRVENDHSNIDSERQKLPLWTQDLTGFDVLKNHQAVLMGWVGGKGALIIEKLSEEQIIQDCMRLLKYFLKNNNLPEPIRCSKSHWANNKFIRGSYSHITKKCDLNSVSPATLAEPLWGTVISNDKSEILPILMFAGEATHENFYSTTHGAYETGIKQAQIFLDHHVK